MPSRLCRVTAHHGRRVAPFGDRGITGCQPLPRAFRRVAASFLGCRRQGIHRPPINAELHLAPPNAPPSPTRASSASGCPGSFGSAPGHGTRVHVSSPRDLKRVRALHACMQPCVSSVPPLHPRLRGQRASANRAPWDQVAKLNCQSAGENRGTSDGRLVRWSRGDSNPGPPPCKGGALPAKLRPRFEAASR